MEKSNRASGIVAPDRKRKPVQINWLMICVSCMVLVTLATTRPKAEKVAEPIITSRKIAGLINAINADKRVGYRLRANANSFGLSCRVAVSAKVDNGDLRHVPVLLSGRPEHRCGARIHGSDQAVFGKLVTTEFALQRTVDEDDGAIGNRRDFTRVAG